MMCDAGETHEVPDTPAGELADEGESGRTTHRVASTALGSGFASVVAPFLVIPFVIGPLVGLLAGSLALGLGTWGWRRRDRVGRAGDYAAVAMLLGALGTVCSVAVTYLAFRALA
ncbi:hypothetical protein [Streptomyces oceani]|uniref:Uncharacterized protein n=1 Tax=Streptomyces oceani TaxID=1075402 RepID=A0A1E7KPQ5_9ACTN|nr:hypothetical protein [Streptomyces oceani]OEV05925.1 hypothetical protein AN216_01245 [Streptomyces oceani]